VCRLIYNEIRTMDKFFNFRGAAYLGFCLNVLGLERKRNREYRQEEDSLRRAVLHWVQNNYCRMRTKSPKVAEACLHGSITFDAENLEFVNTYSMKRVMFRAKPVSK